MSATNEAQSTTGGTNLTFDPVASAKANAPSDTPGAAANSGASAPSTDVAGGGNISANGTYYSLPTRLDGVFLVTSVFKTTGTIAGTLSVEVMDDPKSIDDAGTADWHTYDRVTGAGFTAGVATLAAGAITGGSNPGSVELQDLGFGAMRYKLTITSGTGTIKERRTLKGS